MESARVGLRHARAGRLRCVAADGLGHYSALEAAVIIDPLPVCLALSVGRTGLRHRLAIDRRLRSHRLQVVGRALYADAEILVALFAGRDNVADRRRDRLLS